MLNILQAPGWTVLKGLNIIQVLSGENKWDFYSCKHAVLLYCGVFRLRVELGDLTAG